MIYTKKIGNNNGSGYIVLPIEVLNWLQVSLGDDLTLQDNESQEGRYITIFNPETYKPNPQ